MKPLLAVTVTLTLALATASPQGEPPRLYTNPTPPTRYALDRLNLTLAWSHRIKTGGQRDGLNTIQFMPGRDNLRLVVQTFQGDVIVLDAETGDTVWRAAVGTPYTVARPVAFNARSLFTTRKEQIYVLDRETGKQLLYGIDKDSKLHNYGMPLESVPSAGLAADNENVYVCMESYVAAYFVPGSFAGRRVATQESEADESKDVASAQLRLDWTRKLAPQVFSQPPLVTRDYVGLLATDGTIIEVSVLEGIESSRYQVERPVTARAAQHGNMAYLGSTDYHLYAFDLARGRLAWRFSAAGPVVRPVHATDRDVYVSPERVGLYRLHRATGAERWLNRDAEYFLATNGKFVYATDRFGNLLVLDYHRGTTLARYDTRDFTVLVPNEMTDRLYLAAHNGLIVCLHHRDFPKPLAVTDLSGEEGNGKSPPKKGEEKKDGKMDPGMKDGDKKDGDKKDANKKNADKKDAALPAGVEERPAPWRSATVAPGIDRFPVLRRPDAALLGKRS